MENLMFSRKQAAIHPYEGEVRILGNLPANLAGHPYKLRDSEGRSVPGDEVLGLMSGRRSFLTQQDGKMYRFKGVSFRDDPEWKRSESGDTYATRIEGGQFLQNAMNELRMTRRFNRILEREGLPRVANVEAFYVFPQQVERHKIAATVFSVEGDTRLDELLMESQIRFMEGIYHASGVVSDEVEKLVRAIYSSSGFVTGSLLQLLHRNDLSWSDNEYRTNALTGNIVVVHDGKELRFGLVDFDAACAREEFGAEWLRQQQRHEWAQFCGLDAQTLYSNDLLDPSWFDQFLPSHHRDATASLGDEFISGFKKGYAHQGKPVAVMSSEPLVELLKLVSGRIEEWED